MYGFIAIVGCFVLPLIAGLYSMGNATIATLIALVRKCSGSSACHKGELQRYDNGCSLHSCWPIIVLDTAFISPLQLRMYFKQQEHTLTDAALRDWAKEIIRCQAEVVSHTKLSGPEQAAVLNEFVGSEDISPTAVKAKAKSVYAALVSVFLPMYDIRRATILTDSVRRVLTAYTKQLTLTLI
jgi:hypothetical protein